VLNRARRVKQGRRGLTFEVQEVAFSSADGLALADDDGGDHLLSEFGLALLDRSQEHVTDGAGGVPVQASTSATDGDDVQRLRSSVVGAVHDGSHGQRVGNVQLDSVTS